MISVTPGGKFISSHLNPFESYPTFCVHPMSKSTSTSTSTSDVGHEAVSVGCGYTLIIFYWAFHFILLLSYYYKNWHYLDECFGNNWPHYYFSTSTSTSTSDVDVAQVSLAVIMVLKHSMRSNVLRNNYKCFKIIEKLTQRRTAVKYHLL